jgi:hypothetical protein
MILLVKPNMEHVKRQGDHETAKSGSLKGHASKSGLNSANPYTKN